MAPRMHPAMASDHYRLLDLSSRVESASPHGLVGLLYEELLHRLDLAIAAGERGQSLSGNNHVAKAQSIIIALEASIDFERGGELALRLARIYRACREEISESCTPGNASRLSEIRAAISNIAYAWQALGPIRRRSEPSQH
ncbi:MAG: flagellar protein FliS [Sphingomonadaceae bacterium]|nr:flagellar protein FliS [Sphingomonadaceae bacterium]